MERIQINADVGNLLLTTYKELITEKVKRPTKTKKIKKVIEVEEPVKSEKIIKTHNYLPGLVLIILGLILLIVLFLTGSNVLLYIALFSLITGGALSFILKKDKKIVNTTIERIKKEIIEEIELPPEYDTRVIPNDKSIVSLGKINLKFFIINIKGNKLIIPDSEDLLKEKVSFPFLEKYNTFKKEDEKIEKQTVNIPYILEGETEEQLVNADTPFGNKVYLRGYEKDLNHYFQTTENIFAQIKKQEIKFPVLNKPQLTKYFIPVEQSNEFYTEAHELNALINSEEGEDLENFLFLWKEEWASRISLLNNLRINSLQNDISPEFVELGQISQYTSFNFYCPNCNKEVQEEILKRDYALDDESTPKEVYFSKHTKCKFNPIENTWECPVCNSSFVQPLPVHRIMDELFIPVYDNLMEENKIEREKHHSETRKKEAELRFKIKEELEKVYSNHITGLFELQENLDKLNAEIVGESEAINYLEKTASLYKQIQSNVISSIMIENEETNNRVYEYTIEVRNQLREITNTELKDYDENMTHLSKAKQIEDERKEKVLLETLSNGFAKVTDAVNENTEVSRRGFENVTNAVNENTEVSRQGFENVTNAVNKNTNVTRKGLENVNQSIRENTDVARENYEATTKQTQILQDGFSETNKQLKRNNGTQIAMAKKQGIDLRDNPGWRIDKTIKHGLTDLKGAISGKSSIEIETAKEN